MQTIRQIEALISTRRKLQGRVALVPTMGALHAGHGALIAAARAAADHVIVSIFVNPAQFGPNEDFDRYPRTETADAAMLEAAGVDLLWAPAVVTMYPDGFATCIHVSALGDGLCGAHRPGHFDGVATVVAKLFNQTRPALAFFGEKDWQQLAIIRRLTIDLNLGVDVVGVPTVRESDGLALSSRNAYLTAEERRKAVALPHALLAARDAIRGGVPPARALGDARAALLAAGFTPDYLELVGRDLQPLTAADANSTPAAERREMRLVAAARIGATRLIDNLAI